MQNLRDQILRLPFVRQKPNGAPDFWAVEPTGIECRDYEIGHVFGAMFAHFVRQFEAPHLVHYLVDAWYDQSAEARAFDYHLRRGFCTQFASVAMHGYSDDMSLVVPPRIVNHDRAEAVRALPSSRVVGNELDRWAVEPTGDPQDDNAKGRFMMAHLIDMARRIDDPGLMWEIRCGIEQKLDPAQRHILVGANAVAGECVANAPRDTNAYMEATWPFFRDALAGRREGFDSVPCRSVPCAA